MNYSKKERVKIVYKTYNNECMWDADKEKTGSEITNGSGDVVFAESYPFLGLCLSGFWNN